MVSAPTAFEDHLDCLPRVKPLSRKEAAEMLEKDFFHPITGRYGGIPYTPKEFALRQKKECFKKRQREVRNHFNSSIPELEIELKKTFEKYTRVCCFEIQKDSNAVSIYQMWDRYTSFRGIRISFEVDVTNVKEYFMEKVLYVDNRPEINFQEVRKLSCTEYNVKVMQEILRTKLKTYQYEHEYRLIVMPDQCESHFVRDGYKKSSILNYRNLFHVRGIDFCSGCPRETVDSVVSFVRSDPEYKFVPMRRISRVSENGEEYEIIDDQSLKD